MTYRPEQTKVDDAAFTVAADEVYPMGALCDESATDSVDEGDVGLPRMTADRKLLTRIVGSTDTNRAEVNSAGALSVLLSAETTKVIGVVRLADGSGNLITSTGNDLDVNVRNASIAVTNSALTSLGGALKNEDSASANLDVGFPILAVRKATPANTSDADGDYEYVQMSGGRVWASSVITDLVSGTGATNLGKAEDAAHSSGDTGVATWAVRDNQNTSTGHPTTAFGANGDYAPFVVDDNYRLYTQNTGNIAHDGADAGAPVKVGHKAVAHGTNPTAVAASDRTDWYANRHGVPFTLGGHPNIITTEFHFTAAQTDTALITVSSGTKIVVTQIDAMVSRACTVNVGARIGFAASTLTAVSSSGVTGIVLSHGKFAPGSGVVKGNGSGIIGIGADGEDLRITSDVPTTGNLRVTVTYFTIES